MRTYSKYVRQAMLDSMWCMNMLKSKIHSRMQCKNDVFRMTLSNFVHRGITMSLSWRHTSQISSPRHHPSQCCQNEWPQKTADLFFHKITYWRRCFVRYSRCFVLVHMDMGGVYISEWYAIFQFPKALFFLRDVRCFWLDVVHLAVNTWRAWH